MARGGFSLVLLAAAALAGCGSGGGTADVAFIDSPENLFDGGIRLSSGAQHVRAATEAGLVALDAQGGIVPALADRWIVTDDGRSFIFRLRDGTWSDGDDLTAESARAELREAIRALDGTSLGLDLAPIEEVRAMAGRVVEIRLSAPVPMLLQLLAQPELALDRGDASGSGDMLLEREGVVGVFAMKPPSLRGVPEEPNWERHVRPVIVRAATAAEAVAQFDAGEAGLVLGGRIGALPLVDTGPLSRGTVQIDPALGLFGMRVRRASGLLSTAQGREALAMALDREALIASFNIAGWTPTTRIVAPGLPGDPGLIVERWRDEPIETLRARAANRVAEWRRANGDAEARLTLAMERSPGLDLLFRELATQLGTIDVRLERASGASAADLVLVDRVARYAAARWFLNQFNCSLGGGMCDSDADALVREADEMLDSERRAVRLAEAEAELTLANVYIPFGSPLRFSLVRGTVDGFAPNQWAFHPLPPLAVIPR